MMHRQLRLAVLASLLVLGFAAAAAAQDDPLAVEERVRIETALREAGFTRWGRIERVDHRWEVEGAIDADGRKFDLGLDGDFRIVKRDLGD
jgi:hypothetical protein